MKGTMRVDVSPTPVDSTAVDTPKNESAVVENKSVPQATAAREEADAKQVVRDREHDERMLKLREERGAREQLPKDEREKLMRELPPRDSAVGQKVRPRE